METTVAALNRKAWGLFLLAAALALVWFGLNFLAPELAVGQVSLRLVLMLAADAVVLYGLWQSLSRTGFSLATRATAWLAVALVMTIWIAADWTLAANGVFRRGIGNVPTLPIAILLPILLGLFVLTRSQTVASLLDATPPSWLVGV